LDTAGFAEELAANFAWQAKAAKQTTRIKVIPAFSGYWPAGKG
jgi:hypothetical protein